MRQKEHLLPVPKIRQLPFANKNGEDQGNTLPSPNGSDPTKRILASLLGGHQAPHLDFSLLRFPGDFKWDFTTLSTFICLQLVKCNTSCTLPFPPPPLCQAWTPGPIWEEILTIWSIQVSYPFWESIQNVTAISLTSTWRQIWPGTKYKGAEKGKAIRTHYIYIYNSVLKHGYKYSFTIYFNFLP